MMCAMVGERRGIRMRSRSGEWVEKCRTRREGPDGEGESQKRAGEGRLAGMRQCDGKESGDEGV